MFCNVYCSNILNIDQQKNFSDEITKFTKISNYTFIGLSSFSVLFTIIFLIFNSTKINEKLNLIEKVSITLHLAASLYTAIISTIFIFKTNLSYQYFSYVALYISILELFNLFCPLILNFKHQEDLADIEFLLIYVSYIITAVVNFTFFNFHMIDDYNQNAIDKSIDNIKLLTIESNQAQLSQDDKNKISQATSAINQYLTNSFSQFINDIDNGLNNGQIITNPTSKLVVDSIKNFVSNSIYQPLNININNTSQTSVYDQLLSNPNNDITAGITDLLVSDIESDDPYSNAISNAFLKNSNLSNSVVQLIVNDINTSTTTQFNPIDNQIQTLIQNIINQNINQIVSNYVSQNVLNSCESGSINLAIWNTQSALYSNILTLFKTLTSSGSSNILSSIDDIIINQFNSKYITTLNPLLSNDLQNTLNNLFKEQMTSTGGSPAPMENTVTNIILNLISSGSTTNNFIYASMQNIQNTILSGSTDIVSAINSNIAQTICSTGTNYADSINQYLQSKYGYTDIKSYINSQISSLLSKYNVFPIAYPTSTTSISPLILDMICKQDLNNQKITPGIYNYILSTFNNSTTPFDFYDYVINAYKNSITTDSTINLKQALINSMIDSYTSGIASYSLKQQIAANIQQSNIISKGNLQNLQYLVFKDTLLENLEFEVLPNNSSCLKNQYLYIANLNAAQPISNITFSPNTLIIFKDLCIVFKNSQIVSCIGNNQVINPNTSSNQVIGSCGITTNQIINTVITYPAFFFPYGGTITYFGTSQNGSQMTGFSYQTINDWIFNYTSYNNPLGAQGMKIMYTSGFAIFLSQDIGIVLTTSTCLIITKSKGFQQLVSNNGQAAFVTPYTYLDVNNTQIWTSPDDPNITINLSNNNSQIIVYNRAKIKSPVSSLLASTDVQTSTLTYVKADIDAHPQYFVNIYAYLIGQATINNFLTSGVLTLTGTMNMDTTLLLKNSNVLDPAGSGKQVPGVILTVTTQTNNFLTALPPEYVNTSVCMGSLV